MLNTNLIVKMTVTLKMLIAMTRMKTMCSFLPISEKPVKIVQKIHRSTKLQDKLHSLQLLANVPELKVINGNTTRWKSLLRMLRRFVELKDLLPFVVTGELDNFNWRKFSEIIEALQPIQLR